MTGDGKKKKPEDQEEADKLRRQGALRDAYREALPDARSGAAREAHKRRTTPPPGPGPDKKKS